MQKSESVKELATAMVAAQKVMRHATKDTTNPFFKSKYADFASVWDACREALNNNGIAVTQLVGHDMNDDVLVETVFLHTSGEWMSSNIKMTPVKKDPQSIGSAITYARRYALSGMACIATEEDDDGNSATGNKAAPVVVTKGYTAPSAPAAPIAPDGKPDGATPPVGAAPAEEVINQAQRKMFYASCKGAGLMDEQIKRLMMEKTGVDSSTKLDNAKMNTILAIVRDAKAVADLKIAWAKADIGGE